MDNSSNETNVQVAPTVSEVSGKPDNQGKRGAENILDKVVIAKKQKKETKMAVQEHLKKLKNALQEVPSKRKLETNSSNDETLSDLGEEEDTPEAAEKHTAPDANLEKKQESCPSESDADEDDAFEDSSNFEESFEKSSDEESKDEKPLKIPKKNEDVTMKDATVDSAQKQTKMSEKKVPKTPTVQNPTSGSQTLYVANLSYEVGEHDLSEFFKGAGEVVGARLATRGNGRSKGFGHVDFATEEDVKKALELNGQEFFGRALKLEVARERDSNTPQSGNKKGGKDQSHSIFVKGFDKSLGLDQAFEDSSNSEESFEKSSDEESEDEKPLEIPKKNKDVEMKDATFDSAQKQTKMSEKKVPKTPTGQNPTSGSQTLYVGNLSYDVGEHDLLEFFRGAGEVVGARIATRGKGSSKGFGHVDFATEEDVKKALELNGQEFFGRALKLEVAHERDSNTPQSGNEKDGKDQSQTIFVKGFDKSLGHDQIREKGSKDQSQTIFVKGFDKSLRHDQIREKGGKDQSQTIFVKGFDKSLGHDQIRKKGGKDQSQIIFVKGFDKSLGYDQIRNSLEKHFGSCGDITRISILRNHESGAPKGMAFLDFKDQNACNEALKLNGSELGGRTLTVDEGKPKGDNSDGRGKGGGKFSGRGGGRGGRGDRGRGRGSRGRGRGRGGERVGRGDRSRGRSSGGRGRRRGGAGKNFSDSDD